MTRKEKKKRKKKKEKERKRQQNNKTRNNKTKQKNVQCIALSSEWWWLIPRRRGLLGRLEGWWSVLARSLVAVESESWCAHPTALWTGERLGWGWLGGLLALSSSCVFLLRLQASLPRTYDWLFSLLSDNCLGLGPPAAMTEGRFPPMQADSSAGLY